MSWICLTNILAFMLFLIGCYTYSQSLTFTQITFSPQSLNPGLVGYQEGTVNLNVIGHRLNNPFNFSNKDAFQVNIDAGLMQGFREQDRFCIGATYEIANNSFRGG